MSATQPKVQALRAQLQQLQSLHQSGALSDELYRQGRETLERKIIDAVLQTQTPTATRSPAAVAVAVTPRRKPGRLTRQVGLVLAALVLAAGSAWWLERSEPDEAGAGPEPLAPAAPAPQAAGDAEVATMAEGLAARLKAQPDDADGWMMLGRSYEALSRHDEALAAYEHALKLKPNNADAMADYADALAFKNGRKLEGEPMKWIAKALATDPDNLKALALAGTEAFDRGDYPLAIQHWERAQKVGPPEHPMVRQASEGVAEARVLANMPAAASAATR